MKQELHGITGAALRVECPTDWLRDNDHWIEPLRDDTGRRLYTDEHIARAKAIRQARRERRHG